MQLLHLSTLRRGSSAEWGENPTWMICHQHQRFDQNFQIIVTNAMLSRYNPNIEIRKGSRPPLNPDHTHFIMVDDGYRNRLAAKNHKKVSNMWNPRYVSGGGIQTFISAFERMVLHLNWKFSVLTSFEKVMDPAPRGLGVPVVTLLLEVKNTLVGWNTPLP